MCLAADDITDDHQMSDRSHTITSSPLMIIESFLAALTNADQDGRIVINKKKGSLYASIRTMQKRYAFLQILQALYRNLIFIIEIGLLVASRF